MLAVLPPFTGGQRRIAMTCGTNHEGEGCGCECECECCGGDEGGLTFVRHFQTKEEQLEELEAYQSELKKELKAVEEHIADLKK
jgi:hypothetical protein